MSTSIQLSESLQKTISFEQRALADSGTLIDRNNTVNSIPYSLLRLNPSLVITPSSIKESKIHSIIPNNNFGDLTYTRADTNGTVVNKDGFIENACYNLLPNSNTLSAWTQVGSPSIVLNSEISPDGTMNAAKVGGTGTEGIFESTTGNFLLPLLEYTRSVYLKRISGAGTCKLKDPVLTQSSLSITTTNNWVRYELSEFNISATNGGVWLDDIDGEIAVFGGQLVKGSQPKPYLKTTDRLNMPRISWRDGKPFILNEPERENLFLNSQSLSTQDVTTVADTYTISFRGTGTITLSGTATGTLVGTGVNDKVSLTFTATAGTCTSTVTGTVEYANFELGDYDTSWIPTTGTALTRNTDEINTGVPDTSKFNSQEGTLYIKLAALSQLSESNRHITISDGTSGNSLRMVLNLDGYVRVRLVIGGVSLVSLDYNTTNITDITEILIKYKQGDYALKINGVERDTDLNNTPLSANVFDRLNFDFLGLGVGGIESEIYKLVYFPSADTYNDF